jgi:ankyrin repeat protein
MADEEGRTPAHIAASTGHVDALRALVEELISPAPSSSSSSSSSSSDKTINDTKTEGGEEAADKQASSPSAGAGAGAAAGGGGGAKLPPPGLGLVLVKDAAGCFPAHFAAKGGHTECLQYIHGLSTVSSLHAQR